MANYSRLLNTKMRVDKDLYNWFNSVHKDFFATGRYFSLTNTNKCVMNFSFNLFASLFAFLFSIDSSWSLLLWSREISVSHSFAIENDLLKCFFLQHRIDLEGDTQIYRLVLPSSSVTSPIWMRDWSRANLIAMPSLSTVERQTSPRQKRTSPLHFFNLLFHGRFFFLLLSNLQNAIATLSLILFWALDSVRFMGRTPTVQRRINLKNLRSMSLNSLRNFCLLYSVRNLWIFSTKVRKKPRHVRLCVENKKMSFDETKSFRLSCESAQFLSVEFLKVRTTFRNITNF